MLKKLPSELRKRKIWINGLLTERGELPAKCPVNGSGYMVAVNKRKNLISFDDAVSNHIGDAQLGVGVVFIEDKKFPLVGIDFDPGNKEKVWTKETLAFARALCEESGSYYERSINGGFHVLGLLDSYSRIGRKGKLNTPHGPIKFEVYSADRYFLCTGKRCKGSPRVVSGVQGIVNRLLKRHSESAGNGVGEGAKKGKGANNGGPADSAQTLRSPALTDDAVLAAIANSTQCLTFNVLHQEGDLSEYNNDHSGAVMAWHSIIAFYTQDYKQVTRLFRKSALNFGKWKAEPNRKGGKWRRINKAGESGGQHAKIVSELKRVYGIDKGATEDAEPDQKYVALLEAMGEVRRDLFTGDLFVHHEGYWKNAFGTHIENHLKALCQARGGSKADWCVTQIIPSLTHHMHSLTPKLLVDIPEWDGRDRILEMCAALTPADPKVTNEIIVDIVKMTLSQCVQKLYNPLVQPRMLILQGEQGIGKDLWLQALLDGFGQYVSTLTIAAQGKEKDYAETIVRSAVIIVSEFDKVRTIGTGLLKDLISKAFFDFRPAYGRVSQRYYCRCTWFGACNPDQILTEAGANRRFVPIKLLGGRGEAIKWDYERSAEYSTQILAQMAALAAAENGKGYQAAPETEAVLRKINESYAPEDTTEMILESFDDWCLEEMARQASDFSLFRLNDLGPELGRICRSFGMPLPALLQLLKATGRRYRHEVEGRFYGLPQHASGYAAKTSRKRFIKKLKQDSKDATNRFPSDDSSDGFH